MTLFVYYNMHFLKINTVTNIFAFILLFADKKHPRLIWPGCIKNKDAARKTGNGFMRGVWAYMTVRRKGAPYLCYASLSFANIMRPALV